MQVYSGSEYRKRSPTYELKSRDRRVDLFIHTERTLFADRTNRVPRLRIAGFGQVECADLRAGLGLARWVANLRVGPCAKITPEYHTGHGPVWGVLPPPADGAGSAAPAARGRRGSRVPPQQPGRQRGAGAAATPSSSGVGDRVEAMKEPHPIFREAIPAAKRPSREELIETANHYFTGLSRNDGKGYYPFTDDCDRFENGVAMTQRNCKQQFEQSLRGIVSRIRDRRFVAVDRERGIVFSFAFFDHEQINWTWQLAELFKIENGLIRRVESSSIAPYGP